jgi:hypothetical protein
MVVERRSQAKGVACKHRGWNGENDALRVYVALRCCEAYAAAVEVDAGHWNAKAKGQAIADGSNQRAIALAHTPVHLGVGIAVEIDD